MEPISIAILSIIGLFVLIALQIPIGVAMGLTGFVAYGLLAGFGPAVSLFGTEAASAFSHIELAVIPMFLLMGNFATVGGLSSDIYNLAYGLIGHKRGGLALSTIAGCAGFGAVCGSSVATAATMTKVALPEMIERNYKPSLAAGSVAAGGTLGFLIPPSIVMVLYAVLTEQFIVTLFIAAIIPGLIAVLLHAAAISIVVRIDPKSGPAGPTLTARERWTVFVQSWAVLVLAIIVTGGIYGGIFTVTEAAAAGAVLAFIFAFARRRLTWHNFFETLLDTAATTGMIYLILIGASIFSYFITLSQLPEFLVDAIQSLKAAHLAVIFLLLLMYLVLGSIFETIASMLITLPFVLPLVTGMGYDPVWWGIMMVMVIEVGMITPPIGLNVFVVHGMAPYIPLSRIFIGILPFLAADLVRLTIIALFPSLTLWLPSTMG